MSFISVTLLLPRMYGVLKQGGSAVVLIKPQFESDTKKVGKNGIVRDENARKENERKMEEARIRRERENEERKKKAEIE